MEKTTLTRFLDSEEWKLVDGSPSTYQFVDQVKYKEPAQLKELSNITLLESFQHMILRCTLFQELIFDTSHLENLSSLLRSLPQNRHNEIEPFVSLFNLLAQGFSTFKTMPTANGAWVTEMYNACKFSSAEDPILALSNLLSKITMASRMYFAFIRNPDITFDPSDNAEVRLKEHFLPQLRKVILEGYSKEFGNQQLSKDDSQDPDDSLILVQTAAKLLPLSFGWSFESPPSQIMKLNSIMTEMTLKCNQERLRSLFAETKSSSPKGLQFKSPFLDEWSFPVHPTLTHPFRRFNFSGNTSIGLLDLSSLKYTNEKNLLGVEVFRRVSRLKADGSREAKLHIFKCSLEFVKGIQIRGPKNELLPKTNVPFELPHANTVIKKINDVDTSCDYAGDYDIGIFYVGNSADFGHRWCQVNLDEHISALKQRQMGVLKMYVALQNNPRITHRKYLKVVYTQAVSEKDPNFEFRVWVPEDEYSTLSDFVDYLEETYFKLDNDSKTKVPKLRKDLLDCLNFSLSPSTQSDYYTSLSNKESGFSEGTLLHELLVSAKEKYNLKNPKHLAGVNEDDNILHCLITNSGGNAGGLDWFKAEPVRNEHKPPLDLRMSLTNLVDYVLGDGEALSSTGPDRQKPLTAEAFGSPVSRSIFLPGLLLVWTKYVNNLVEFSEPFDFKAAAEPGQKEQMLSTKYELLGLFCKKKQPTPSSPPVYYPVIKTPGSSEVVGYVASKEVTQQLDKLKCEFIEGILLQRQGMDLFS